MSMINCPECGQRVSTMAGTCPHCGIKIAGNLKKCPNCGEYCINEHDQCPHCHATLSVVTTDTFIDPENEATNIEPEVKNENSKKEPLTPTKKDKNITPIFIAIAIILALCIGGLYILDVQKNRAKEESDYTRLENVTNPEFYQQFLIDYPDSRHYSEVEERMKRLMDESGDWEKVLAEKKRSVIIQFMQSHPNSVRTPICETMIDSIDWHDAISQNTDEAIDEYLRNHPEGIHAADAAEKKNEIAKMRITEQDVSMIRGIIASFLNNGVCKQDLEQISAAIPESMESFMGIEGATAQQIADYAKEKMAQDVIGLHYIVDGEMNVRKVTLPDSSLGYAVDFNMGETISRSDTNMPTTHDYSVSALLSADRKIIKMNIK